MIVFIGPLPNSNPKSIGGATVLFDDLKNYLKDAKGFKIIAHNKPNPFGRFGNLFSICKYIVFYTRYRDIIVINISSKGVKTLLPFVLGLCKILKRRIGVRKFGGDDCLEAKNKLFRSYSSYLLKKCDMLWVETKYLVGKYKHLNPNTFWLPNSRLRNSEFISKQFKRRFIFIGQIKREKGVLEILEAFKELGNDYVCEMYGPIFDESIRTLVENSTSYKGYLLPDMILDKLKEFDCILLPTYYEGEGYPGIIIEAYSVGLPCITTIWKSIPEIVDHEVSGILIEPGSGEQLIKAIRLINNDNYPSLSRNAFNKFKEFDSSKVYPELINTICRSINSK